MSDPALRSKTGWFGSIGPALIVAAVVLGPGSILANSRVGWLYGYDMVWVLVAASVLLVGMTALSARLGVHLDETLCTEVARRAGRPLAALTGASLFLVAACFQFGNNLGVLYAVEPFIDDWSPEHSRVLAVAVLVALNAGAAIALFGFRRLYVPVERLMKVLVGVMLVGFAGNLFFAGFSPLALLGGLVPTVPEAASETLLPRIGGDRDGTATFVDHLWPVVALVATTFSVGGAFYQSYLVRQKGWKAEHLKSGLHDSIVGIGMLGLMSLMVMVTASSVLHGNADVKSLNNAADVARQLQPLFGVFSTSLFCIGIFAGAFSSFLVNAMIGGTVLSDGLGKGGDMDAPWPRWLTLLVLASGMLVAIGTKTANLNTGNLIIFAQAITVFGNPLLAGVLLWLACRRELGARGAVPLWMKGLSGAGFLVVLGLSAWTGHAIYLRLAS